jgi:O-acetyl-ADP-ribose deacetylase (regulator of RNase III)
MPLEKPKPRPTAFVGSSSESRGIAQAILQNLEGKVEITCWYHDFFEPTSSVLDDLVAKVSRFDFGVFIFVPDDVVQIRKESSRSVRDNVLFELGLFIGRLGIQRVFIVANPDFEDIRVPTDLTGRNLVSFRNRDDGNLVAALESACSRLFRTMEKVGPRPERLRELETARERAESGEPKVWDLTLPENIVAEKQIGGASFVVINDDIRKANTEIVVSSDDNHFTAGGGVSQTILAKVGHDVRRQLDYYGSQQFRQGQIVITTGGDWNRRAIIHAAVIDLDENRYPTVETIRIVTRRILECAVALGARSIAFPVLGGGRATRYLRSSDSVNMIASEILAFMNADDYFAEGLKRVALYVFNRADADALPKVLVEGGSRAS